MSVPYLFIPATFVGLHSGNIQGLEKPAAYVEVNSFNLMCIYISCGFFMYKMAFPF